MGTAEVLDERSKTHGDFAVQARVSQALKRVVREEWVGEPPTDEQAEGLDMLLLKVARIVAGNADEADHWVDMAGYSELVNRSLQKPQQGCSACGWPDPEGVLIRCEHCNRNYHPDCGGCHHCA